MNLRVVNYKPETTVLMFSSGLDSTAALWKLLQEGHTVHCHYVSIISPENRYKAEALAVSKILTRLYAEGYQVQSSFSAVDIPAVGSAFLWDNDITKFTGGWLGKHENVKYVAYGVTKDDDLEMSGSDRITRGTNVFECFVAKEKLLYPVREMSKQECYDSLPIWLRELTWSCRTPRYDSTGVPYACGTCKTCKKLSQLST